MGDGVMQICIVITVYDSATVEAYPYWSDSPVKVHWGYANPSNALGGDKGKRRVFELTHQAIDYCMLQLLALPLNMLSNAKLQAALECIARA